MVGLRSRKPFAGSLMGIKFYCPNGHKLNVKSFLAGKKAICPKCGVKVIVPAEGVVTAPPGEPADAGQGDESVDLSISPVGDGGDDFADFAAAIFGSETSNPAEVAAPTEDAATGETAPSFPEISGPTVMPAAIMPAAISSGVAVAPSRLAAAQPVVAPPAVHDAIAEAPTAVWYVRPPSGGQFGPAAGEIMRQWLIEGRVTASSLVWRAGWPDWRSAGSVFPQLGAALLAPAIGAPAGVLPIGGAADIFAPMMGSPLGAAPIGAAAQPIAIGDFLDVSGAAPTEVDDAKSRRRKRRRSNDSTMIVGGILGVLAIILVIVLVLVLAR